MITFNYDNNRCVQLFAYVSLKKNKEITYESFRYRNPRPDLRCRVSFEIGATGQTQFQK